MLLEWRFSFFHVIQQSLFHVIQQSLRAVSVSEVSHLGKVEAHLHSHLSSVPQGSESEEASQCCAIARHGSPRDVLGCRSLREDTTDCLTKSGKIDKCFGSVRTGVPKSVPRQGRLISHARGRVA